MSALKLTAFTDERTYSLPGAFNTSDGNLIL